MCWGEVGKTSRPCIIWVLGLFLAIASVDTVPDPPAVNPRALSVVSWSCEASRCLRDDWLPFDLSIPYLIQVRWIALNAASDANPRADRIVQVAFATDPSPPAA